MHRGGGGDEPGKEIGKKNKLTVVKRQHRGAGAVDHSLLVDRHLCRDAVWSALLLLDFGQLQLGLLPRPLVLVVLGRQRNNEFDILTLQRRPQPLGRVGQRRREVLGPAWREVKREPRSAHSLSARSQRRFHAISVTVLRRCTRVGVPSMHGGVPSCGGSGAHTRVRRAEKRGEFGRHHVEVLAVAVLERPEKRGECGAPVAVETVEVRGDALKTRIGLQARISIR